MLGLTSGKGTTHSTVPVVPAYAYFRKLLMYLNVESKIIDAAIFKSGKRSTFEYVYPQMKYWYYIHP